MPIQKQKPAVKKKPKFQNDPLNPHFEATIPNDYAPRVYHNWKFASCLHFLSSIAQHYPNLLILLFGGSHYKDYLFSDIHPAQLAQLGDLDLLFCSLSQHEIDLVFTYLNHYKYHFVGLDEVTKEMLLNYPIVQFFNCLLHHNEISLATFYAKKNRQVIKLTYFGVKVDCILTEKTHFEHAQKLDLSVGAIYYNLYTGQLHYPIACEQAFEDLNAKQLNFLFPKDCTELQDKQSYVISRMLDDPTILLRIIRASTTACPEFQLAEMLLTCIAEYQKKSDINAFNINRLYYDFKLLFFSGFGKKNLNRIIELNLFDHIFFPLQNQTTNRKPFIQHLITLSVYLGDQFPFIPTSLLYYALYWDQIKMLDFSLTRELFKPLINASTEFDFRPEVDLVHRDYLSKWELEYSPLIISPEIAGTEISTQGSPMYTKPSKETTDFLDEQAIFNRDGDSPHKSELNSPTFIISQIENSEPSFVNNSPTLNVENPQTAASPAEKKSKRKPKKKKSIAANKIDLPVPSIPEKETWLEKGIKKQEQGLFEEALIAFHNAFAEDKDLAGLEWKIKINLLYLKKFNKAMSDCEKLLDITQDVFERYLPYQKPPFDQYYFHYYNALCLRGSVHLAMNAYDEAIRDFDVIIQEYSKTNSETLFDFNLYAVVKTAHALCGKANKIYAWVVNDLAFLIACSGTEASFGNLVDKKLDPVHNKLIAKAKNDYENVLVITQELQGHFIQFRIEAFRGLGDIAYHLAEYDKADEYYQKGLQTLRHLIKSTNETDSLTIYMAFFQYAEFLCSDELINSMAIIQGLEPSLLNGGSMFILKVSKSIYLEGIRYLGTDQFYPAYTRLIELCFFLQQYSEAITYIQLILTSNTNYTGKSALELNIMLGRCYELQSHFIEAKQAYEQAIKLNFKHHEDRTKYNELIHYATESITRVKRKKIIQGLAETREQEKMYKEDVNILRFIDINQSMFSPSSQDEQDHAQSLTQRI